MTKDATGLMDFSKKYLLGDHDNMQIPFGRSW